MSGRKCTKEQIVKACAAATSFGAALHILNMSESGAARVQLKKYIEEYCIDISHFTGTKPPPHGWNKRKIEEYLSNKYPISTFKLKLRLVKEGYFELKCYSCNETTWLNKPIPLELEHINGNNKDNTLSNLTLLCPNCHAFTPTYRGRNKKINSSKPPKKTAKVQIKTTCVDCNIPISKHATRCKKCTGIIRQPLKIDWPSKEDILKRLEQSNYTKLGLELGVSDNAIRKYLSRSR